MNNPYYITLPGGTPVGPLSLDALKVMARNGGLQAEHLYCTEGAEAWRPITELVIIHSATPVVSPLPMAHPVPATEKVNSYIVPAVVLLALSAMIFVLSLIFAVVAVIYAAMAESAKPHNIELCRRRARVAKIWCIVTGATMGLQVLLLLALLLFAFVSAAGAL